MGQKSSIAVAVVTLALIALTLFLFIKGTDVEAPTVESQMTTTETATTTATTTAIQATSTPNTIAEDLNSDKGELIQVKRLDGGVTHELRKEIAVRRWTHTSGVTATLYRTDEFYDTNGTQNNSFELRATNKEGQEYTLYSFVPDVERLIASRSDISSVEFSPLGTYLVLYESGYESSWVMFYDLRSGKEIEKKDEYGNFLLRGASPYWNVDESRLLLLSNSEEMGGCMDCGSVKFSKTGGFDDVETIADIADHSVYFSDVVINGNVATFTVTEQIFDSETVGARTFKGTATFDFDTGTLRSELPYLNN